MEVTNELTSILRDVLQLGDRATALTTSSPLLGSIPEFDSMAVVSLLTALEEHFEIAFEDDEISEATFETLGSLVSLVEAKVKS